MIFFSLITTALSSVFYGIIATLVIMGVLYIALMLVCKTVVQTPAFYVVGAVMAVLLLIQTTLLIGAVEAQDAADDAFEFTSQVVDTSLGVVDNENIQQVLDSVNEQYPILQNFIDLSEFSTEGVTNLTDAMHQQVTDYLDSFIWHRVWWILGVIIVGCTVVIVLDKPGSAGGGRFARDTLASRGERRAGRSSNTDRVHGRTRQHRYR